MADSEGQEVFIGDEECRFVRCEQPPYRAVSTPQGWLPVCLIHFNQIKNNPNENYNITYREA